MTNFICFLNQWQTLIGSIAGGITALIAALIVAETAYMRELRASAMLLITDLASLSALSDYLENVSAREEVHRDQYPVWLSEHLLAKRPRISEMWEVSMFRVMPVESKLAAHLNLIKTIYTDIDGSLNILQKDHDTPKGISMGYVKALAAGTCPMPMSCEEKARHMILVSERWKRLQKHVACASGMLSDFVLSRYRCWHKITRRFSPSREEIECDELLKSRT